MIAVVLVGYILLTIIVLLFVFYKKIMFQISKLSLPLITWLYYI